MNKVRVLELFGGIGSPHKALSKIKNESNQWKYGAQTFDYELVDMIEFDKNAVKSYNAIHGTNFEVQDVTTWNKDIKVDYLHASTPCQAFSTAGKGKGAEDSRGSILWEHTLRIIKITKPKFITMENVKGLLSSKHKELLKWYLSELEQLGYKSGYQILNAKHYGVPQNRERVFIISTNLDIKLNFPYKSKVSKTIKDILIPSDKWILVKDFIPVFGKYYFENELSQYNLNAIEIDIHKLRNQKPEEINRVAKIKKQKYKDLDFNEYFSDKDIQTLDFNSANHYKGIEGVVGSIRAASDTIHEHKIMKIENVSFNEDSNFNGVKGQLGTLTATQPDFKNKIIMENENFEIMYRRLEHEEIFLLMGFTSEDYEKARQVASAGQLTKQAGNSIVVPVMEAIYHANWNIFKAILGGTNEK